MPFFTEKNSYSTLAESDRKITEACYTAYREKSEGKIWRKVDGQEVPLCDDQKQPIFMDENVASMYAAGKTHSVNAWISFALAMTKESVEPTESMTEEEPSKKCITLLLDIQLTLEKTAYLILMSF